MRVFKCIGARTEHSVRALYFSQLLLFWRCVTISSKELQINDEIRDKELRIIDTDGSQLGIMSASEALDKAAEKNLDLVKISPMAKPPVCKIMDYGKYRFEQAKPGKGSQKESAYCRY